jgi:hypothetical protein
MKPDSSTRQSKTFKVTTQESVQGTYLVEAASQDEAVQKFGHLKGKGLIRWDGVEQTDYMAYEVAVEAVEDVV